MQSERQLSIATTPMWYVKFSNAHTATLSVGTAGAGAVTSVTQTSCGTYTVQGYMPQNDPFEVNSTSVVLRLNAEVASLCQAAAFPAASQLAAVGHRYVLTPQLFLLTFGSVYISNCKIACNSLQVVEACALVLLVHQF